MTRYKAIVRLSCLALAFFLSGAIAMAQTITGSVRGTITDSSGAAIAGASITITNAGTGVVINATSDGAGLYNVSFLPIGYYAVTATAPGFETVSLGPINLQIDQTATADAQLQVGKSTTTVNVEATGSSNLNLENSTVSTSIGSETLENMPLNAQNVQIATLFVPGAINPNMSAMGGAMGTERDAYQGYSEAADDMPSFNGNRQQSNSYILDGVDINETLQNSLGYNPSPFSIQEVHVITGNADAEFGNVNGGEVVMVTKGGTKEFHGNAFEYHEASGLTANTWANNHSKTAKSNFTQNQFGGAVGGPILKNRLFFFANYIGLRYSNPPSQKLYSVPTLAERGLDSSSSCPAGQGDLSGAVAKDGVTLIDSSNGNGAENAIPYANNCVPIINPAAKYLFSSEGEKVLPLPNHAVTDNSNTGGNYVGNIATTRQNNQGDVRVDYTATKADTFMFKFSFGDAWDMENQVPMPVIFPYGSDYPFTNAVTTWTRILSPTIVNNARAGFTRIVLNEGMFADPSGVFGKSGDHLLGIPLANQSEAGFTWMNLGTSDITNFGTGVLPTTGTDMDNNFNYNDTLTWEHGKHITKFGADFLRYQQGYFAPGNLGGLLGSFSYDGNYTGYGLADFMVDKANGAAIAGLTGLFGMRQWRDAAYVQDDWKILPNLTLNLGLRYSYEQPNYETNNKMVNVNIPLAKFAPLGTPLQNMLSYAGQYNPATHKTNSRGLFNPYYLGFMPRVGFALKLNPRLAIHAGYGSTDEMESTGTGLRMTQNAPFQPSFVGGMQDPGAASGGTWFKSENGFGISTSTAGTQFDAWDPNMRPAVIQQFNLNLQYQVDSRTTLQAGYVGQLGQHLAVPMAINQYTEDEPAGCDATCAVQIEPFYSLVGEGGTVIETASRALSNYHALQATMQRQLSSGLQYQVNYTYGKSLTNNPGYFSMDGSSALTLSGRM